MDAIIRRWLKSQGIKLEDIKIIRITLASFNKRNTVIRKRSDVHNWSVNKENLSEFKDALLRERYSSIWSIRTPARVLWQLQFFKHDSPKGYDTPLIKGLVWWNNEHWQSVLPSKKEASFSIGWKVLDLHWKTLLFPNKRKRRIEHLSSLPGLSNAHETRRLIRLAEWWTPFLNSPALKFLLLLFIWLTCCHLFRLFSESMRFIKKHSLFKINKPRQFLNTSRNIDQTFWWPENPDAHAQNIPRLFSSFSPACKSKYTSYCEQRSQYRFGNNIRAVLFSCYLRPLYSAKEYHSDMTRFATKSVRTYFFNTYYKRLMHYSYLNIFLAHELHAGLPSKTRASYEDIASTILFKSLKPRTFSGNWSEKESIIKLI